jgi:predicted alpha/beta hydrolase family esterase
MQNAILVHGWAEEDELYDSQYPTASNSHWFPWLSKQLMIRDIHTVAVEMPNAPYPVYEQWKKEFERFEVHENTTLVGHSCGGGFLIRWLSENADVKVANVVLVAP